jgi:acrylyl-CoA reductase (NADPH)
MRRLLSVSESAKINNKESAKIKTTLVNAEPRALKTGEVLIACEYSSINFKDALAVTGKGQIFQSLPLVGGIDMSGTVTESKDPNFKPGDYVLVTGCDLGSNHDGGYSEYVIESAANVVPRSAHLSSREAMIYGTAGFTAALCLERLLQNGQTPEMGPILITGATGGVGQFAIQFFSQSGFEVHALTGKREMGDRLLSLGAKKIIFTSQLDLSDRPLAAIQYGGAVDNIGGATLAKIMAHTQLWGNIACVGLAESEKLNTTVMPLILRGISLIGISSNNTPRALRLKIWDRLATDLKPKNLESFVSSVVGLDEVVATAEKMLARETHGRILVDIKKNGLN